MKTIGIQIKGSEAIVVVLEKDGVGNIIQTNECSKFKIDDHLNDNQVKEFRDQINTTLDSIGAVRIGIVARNANGKGKMAPSAVSFKLEGIIQLYENTQIEIVWPITTISYFKKHTRSILPNKKYQEDAFDVAYYLINQ